jgi:hypothetical protein
MRFVSARRSFFGITEGIKNVTSRTFESVAVIAHPKSVHHGHAGK